MKTPLEKNKFVELGRKGGKRTAQKYGADYMRQLGLRGLEKRYKKKIKKSPAGRQEKSNQPIEKEDECTQK